MFIQSKQFNMWIGYVLVKKKHDHAYAEIIFRDMSLKRNQLGQIDNNDTKNDNDTDDNNDNDNESWCWWWQMMMMMMIPVVLMVDGGDVDDGDNKYSDEPNDD